MVLPLPRKILSGIINSVKESIKQPSRKERLFVYEERGDLEIGPKDAWSIEK